MAQETELWEKETSTQADLTHERKSDEAATGRDIPTGDGDVGQEQVDAIGQGDSARATGQDHSTDDRESRDPTEGVGAVQDSSLMATDIADISD